jgi:hypothetical protein
VWGDASPVRPEMQQPDRLVDGRRRLRSLSALRERRSGSEIVETQYLRASARSSPP